VEYVLEHESHHAHHPHGTGTRWLDITLAIAATIVSLVSLWLGLHSAHAMEKLVAANSYPYLEQMQNMSSDNPFPDRTRDRIEYMFQNNGVGPARIDWVMMTFKGKPVANLSDLLAACCNGKQSDAKGLNRRGGMAHTLLRPGATLSMFGWDEPASANPVFAALHRQMGDIAITSCYCSVFDECYIRRPTSGKPEPVQQCVAPAVAFQPGFKDD
jgi:hypothetical protein